MNRLMAVVLSIAAFAIVVGGVTAASAAPGDGPGMGHAAILGFADVAVSDKASLRVNIPLMRPILFAAAFTMLQLEPEIGLIFRKRNEGGVDLVGGPTLGLSFHYGPDYRSESSGAGRSPSFFAMGPQVGGYLGLDFKRPGERFNFQLGLSPYVAPLFGVDDPGEHRGVVVGGMLDAWFRFST